MNIALSVRLMGTPPGSGGRSEWLQVIHSINGDHAARNPGAEQYIGAPIDSYEQSGGRWFEEYPEFRVIIKDEHTNYVQAKTPEAAEYLRRAVKSVVGIEVDDNGWAV